jgi:transposase
MPSDEQPLLIEIGEQPAIERPAAAIGALKLRRVDRRQSALLNIDVESLIGPDHKARAIWHLTGQLNLEPFLAALKTREGQAGREAWDPRLLVSLWVYAYSEGIGSAREIERQMEWEAGFRWLAGLELVNHHTLSDFRVEHGRALDQLFAEVLATLEHAGCLTLERVMHDGTKIRAQAGADTFRRERTIEARLASARALVEQMGDPRAEFDPAARTRQQAARERAARERYDRLEQANAELHALRQAERTEAEKQAVRVSLSEPEARRMKHGDGAIAPSYNAQITTDAQEKIIVGAHLSQSASDAHSLAPALDVVEQNLGRRPAQVVADGGYTNRATIAECAGGPTQLIGSLTDPAERAAAAMKAAGIDPAFAPAHFTRQAEGDALRCPAGERLEFIGQSVKRENKYRQYRASGAACAACQFRAQCCPKSAEKGRLVSILVEECAYSERWRSAFRGEGDRDSKLMAITIPK